MFYFKHSSIVYQASLIHGKFPWWQTVCIQRNLPQAKKHPVALTSEIKYVIRKEWRRFLFSERYLNLRTDIPHPDFHAALPYINRFSYAAARTRCIFPGNIISMNNLCFSCRCLFATFNDETDADNELSRHIFSKNV